MSLLGSALTLLAGGVGGGAVSGLTIWRNNRRHVHCSELEQPGLDAAHERDIAQAARQWAAAHDQPAAAPLVADKLRLAYTVNQRRQERRSRRRWWR
jgi:hypothetical protein